MIAAFGTACSPSGSARCRSRLHTEAQEILMTTLVLFGRPASGKGTVGQRLADSGYLACSTGQQMREWASGPSEEQRALRATMAAGGYGSDELAVRIVRDFVLGLPPDST